MCRFKSAIILKDRVFIPDYDSHSDMLRELKIEDTQANAERLFVRAELVPKDGDYASDIATWKYIVDQDILPDWYVPAYDEKRMRDAVTEWSKDRMHIGVDGLKIDSGAGHIIVGCKNVTICGNAQVKYICGNAQVKNICSNAQVKNIRGSAQVENICGNAQVECIWGNAHACHIGDSVHVEYICGNARIGCIFGSVQVERIYDNAQVDYIFGSAYVMDICDRARVASISDNAQMDCCRKWKNKNKLTIQSNALLIDRKNKKIYHSGAWSLEVQK